MAVAASCAFDQWQKDVFFSAAEEVQESADTMESLYRMWLRDRAEVNKSDLSDELRRELQTALGTAKWQLEEFERAVNASYVNCSTNDGRIARHGQFVAAIQSQIVRVEKSLVDSLIKEGKQPFPCVQLDDKERHDLAMFLSSNPRTVQESGYKPTVLGTYSTRPAQPEWTKDFTETASVSDDSRYVAHSEENEIMKTIGKSLGKGVKIDKQSRTWSSPNIGAWKIMIGDEEDVEKTFESRTLPSSHVSKFCRLMKNVGKTAKLKWPRNGFRKEKSEENFHLKNGISSYLDLKRVPWFSQGRNDSDERHVCYKENLEVSRIQEFCGRVGVFKQQGHAFSSFGPSLRITLLLMLILFLFVPFVLYTN